MAAFTIILPHKRNSGNDRALRVALECLFTNTVNEFHLLIDAVYDQPLYPRINKLMAQATTDCVVYWSSDMFPAKNWDQPMLDLWDKNTIVTNVLVEPGVIGVHPANLHRDFGKTPEQYLRDEFEEWAETAPVPERYWYAPYMVSKTTFFDMGALQENLQGDDQGFSAADEVFFNGWAASGRKIARAKSFAYHLQRWSEPVEQTAEKRKNEID